jgi:myo-inositol-1(or 4)-monophosphatase
LEDRNGLWAVDPVDGTTNYSFGSPIWGVTCALIRGDRAELGAVFLPDLGEMYLARLGGGAWCNGRRLEPIPKGLIEAHHPISYGDSLLRRFPGRRWPGKMRCAGAFVVEGAFVAQQRFRGLIGMREKLYDIAGILALCGELGADIRYASGAPLLMSSLKEDRSLPEPWIVFPAESGFFLEGVASE